jgi:hypothetical protein
VRRDSPVGGWRGQPARFDDLGFESDVVERAKNFKCRDFVTDSELVVDDIELQAVDAAFAIEVFSDELFLGCTTEVAHSENGFINW